MNRTHKLLSLPLRAQKTTIAQAIVNFVFKAIVKNNLNFFIYKIINSLYLLCFNDIAQSGHKLSAPPPSTSAP